MRVYTAGLATETNSFSPLPTRLEDFTLVRGGVGGGRLPPFEAPLKIFRERARERGIEVVEGLCAHATPSGPTEQSAYEALRDEILDGLSTALPVNAVLLNLHGSMAASECPDTEGDLLSRARQLVGPEVPIGAELDLHCHPTSTMLAHSDVLVTYKHWPHVDSEERANELFDIVVGAAQGRIQPRMCTYNTRLIGLFPTEREPMAGFVARMKQLEQETGVLSISFAHDHPWTDVPELGARLLVTTDGGDGGSLAGQLGRELYAMRQDIAWTFPGLDAGIDAALASEQRPVVLVDMSDNPGGGAPGDGTQLLEALLARGVHDTALWLWDPDVAHAAFDAGPGAELAVRLGGKSGACAGNPLDLKVTVTACKRDLSQRSPVAAAEMGDAAALCCRGIDVVVSTRRAPTHSPDCFEKLGIDPRARRILVAKTLNNARPGFDDVAARYLWVDSGGACTGDVRRIRFRNHEAGLWPFEDDPLGVG